MGLEQKGLFGGTVPRESPKRDFSHMVFGVDVYMSEDYAEQEGEKVDLNRPCFANRKFFYANRYFEVVLKADPNIEREFSSIRELNENLEFVGIRFGFLKVGSYVKLDGEKYHYVIAELTEDEIRDLGDRAVVSLDIAELERLLLV
jgi:hypothetical protein